MKLQVIRCGNKREPHLRYEQSDGKYILFPLKPNRLFGYRYKNNSPFKFQVSTMALPLHGDVDAMICFHLFGHFLALEMYYVDNWDLLPKGQWKLLDNPPRLTT